MRRFAIALAFWAALGSGPALALSCLLVEPEQAFGAAQASPNRYSVVVGRFAFDASQMPQGGPGAEGVAVPGRLVGRALSKSGFNAPYDRAVELEFSCVASWCGGLDPQAEYLAFVEHRDTGFRVEISPCPQWVFANPDRATQQAVSACLSSGNCRPAF